MDGGRVEIRRCLLKRGVAVKALTKDGATVQQLAMFSVMCKVKIGYC